MIWLAGAALFAGLFILGYAGFGTPRVSKSRLGIEKQPRDVNRSVTNIASTPAPSIAARSRTRRSTTSMGVASAVAASSLVLTAYLR